MRRGRTLLWMLIGGIVAAMAVVIALVLVDPNPSPKAASSPDPSVSASASPQAAESAPVVIPKNSSTSSFSYLSHLTPSGISELVDPGPVKIHGSIYPKSILFYCNDGDPAAWPSYKLKHNARRFEATVGLAAKFPPHYQAGVSLVGDGHTLKTFSVSVVKPKTVDVNIKGIHTLQLECFSSGMTSSAEGWNVAVSWGNARITAGH